jgi:tripartite ATP-independent transporter DctP family solute receptor
MAASHSINKTALYFADQVRELSKGKMEVDVFEAATLGSESQNLEALRSGSLDMAIIAVEFYTNIVPDVGTLVLPYIYSDYENQQAILSGEAGHLAAEQIKDKCDAVVLSYYVLAFRQIFTTDKPVNTVNDLKGLKIRVPESNLYVNTFSLLGASPTPVAWGETYTALDTGVVGGLENTPESILSASMNEVTKYMNITNHISAPTTFSISNKVYSKLTAEQQDILKEAAKRASEYGLKLTQENDNVAREKLKKSMEIVNTDVISMKNKIDYSSFDCMKSAEAKKIFDLVQRDSKK